MAGVKPPNILVLSEPGEGHFERIKSDIFQCLGKDRYTVYPLSEKDIYSQPWQENCLLLVVPPHVPLSNRIRRYLLSYIKGGGAGGGARGGGKCLSFNPGLVPSMSHDGIGTVAGAVQLVPCDTSIKPFYTLRSMDTSDNNGLINGTSAANGSVDDDSFVTGPDLMSDATTTIIGDVLVDGVTVPCVKHVTWTGSSSKGEEGERGQLMYSSVHLFDPLIFTSDLPGVIKIKETGREREEFLASVVFRGLGLIVDTEGKRMEEELSPVYLVTKDEKIRSDLLSRLISRKGKSVDGWFTITGPESSCLFITDDFSIGTPVDPIPATNEKQVTVILNPSKQQLDNIEFDSSLYFESLKSTSMGQSLLLGPIMTSSQTLFTGNTPLTGLLTNELGVVCSPGQQTKGKGRGGNVWLSPKGCMMFSVPVQFPANSRLGRTASIVQHIGALSVVTAVRRQPGYEDVPIQVKWPNDIYYDSKVKLGGCLVTAYTTDDTTTAIIGLGVNVSNHYPTLSINDCIRLYNTETHSDLPLLRLESLLALTISNFEMYLSLYNQWGLTAIEGLYYQYWMHHNARVELSGYPGVESAVITGITEHGYLRVRTDNNEFLSLGPDGNTFDIMKGHACMGCVLLEKAPITTRKDSSNIVIVNILPPSNKKSRRRCSNEFSLLVLSYCYGRASDGNVDIRGVKHTNETCTYTWSNQPSLGVEQLFEAETTCLPLHQCTFR